MKKVFLSTIFSLFLIINSLGQGVQFSASAKSIVAVGERFYLTFSVNSEGRNFKPPQIKDFNTLSGPSQSSSTQVSFVNGSMTQSVNSTYQFIIEAVKEGTFTVPPAKVTVGSKEYASNAVTVKVVKAGQATQSQAQTQQKGKKGGGGASAQTDNINWNRDLFVKASVNKTNPLQGEAMVLTYKIYTRLAVAQYSISKTNSLSGFWSQNLTNDNSKNIKQYTETVNGVKYNVAEIRKVVLVPEKSGKLTIAPLEVECIVQIQVQRRSSNPFDDFFNDPFFSNPFSNSVQNVNRTVTSNAISVNVRPLPENKKPSDFSGSVGNLTFKSNIDKTKGKTNEGINLKFTYSGKGNLKLIEKPALELPPDIETYDPKINDNIIVNESGISGTRTYEYLLIPRKAGNFKIKPVSFTYFDITKNSYITQTSPEIILNIEKGVGGDASIAVGSVNKEDIKYLNSDVHFIYNKPFKLYDIEKHFLGSMLYYIIISIIILLFSLFFFLYRKQLQLKSNVMLMKNRKSTKVAYKRLKTAQKLMNNNENNAFYEEIFRALWGYLSDKLYINLSELNKDKVTEVLTEKNISPETITQFIDTLNNCEFARFAPSDNSNIMMEIYNQAVDIITKIEKEIK